MKSRRRSTFFEPRVTVLAEIVLAGAVLLHCTAGPPPPPATAPRPSAATSPSVAAPPAPAGASVYPVTAAELGASWRAGCPVEPARLRRVEVNYIGFDGQTHRGELIVDNDLVPQVISIFE